MMNYDYLCNEFYHTYVDKIAQVLNQNKYLAEHYAAAALNCREVYLPVNMGELRCSFCRGCLISQ